MEKVFMLKGLDCPNCSAKIEKEVGALDGITSSTVNLMKQTLTITVDEDRARTITPVIESIVHTHEPDVEVQEKMKPLLLPAKKKLHAAASSVWLPAPSCI